MTSKCRLRYSFKVGSQMWSISRNQEWLNSSCIISANGYKIITCICYMFQVFMMSVKCFTYCIVGPILTSTLTYHTPYQLTNRFTKLIANSRRTTNAKNFCTYSRVNHLVRNITGSMWHTNNGKWKSVPFVKQAQFIFIIRNKYL